MRFLKNALSGREPLLIEPSRATDHNKAAEAAGFTDALAALFGEVPKAYKAGSVGVIPLKGVVGKSLSPLDRMTGAVDLDEFTASLEAFAVDPEVKTIVIDVSSPGGTVTGVEEAAAMLASVQKPTVAFTDTEAASAAFWISSQADRLVVTPSATVGSIGVYMAIPDVSKAYESMGVRMDVIKSGTLKGAGIEGTSLSEAQRANLQEQVNAIHADFKAAVLGKRRSVEASDMEGQVFSGKVAAQKGLVTGLTSSFQQLIADLNGSTAALPKMAKAKTALKALGATLAPKAITEPEDALSPRQKMLYDKLEEVAETFGQFDQSTGSEGAHYVAVSPFASEGLVCSNCVFFVGGRGCEIVSGDIAPEAVCKFWVIPQELIRR